MILDVMEKASNIDKMFMKNQHKLGIEETGPEGYKGGVRRDKTWKSLLGTLVLL